VDVPRVGESIEDGHPADVGGGQDALDEVRADESGSAGDEYVLDAIDGSPVYDLAPYFREMGPRGEVREPSWPDEMLADYWDTPQS
jgi:hypothetical protein